MSYLGRTPTYGLFEKQTFIGDGNQTTWALDYVVPTASSIRVSVAGVIQEPEESYAISGGGTQISFLESPPNNARIYIVFLGEKLQSPVTTVDDGAVTRAKLSADLEKHVPDWRVANSNITVESGQHYIVDTSGGALTLTLPLSPAFGDTIRFIDGTGSFSTNALTVDANGGNIMGSADDLLIETKNAAFGLVYYNATNGWRLLEV